MSLSVPGHEIVDVSENGDITVGIRHSLVGSKRTEVLSDGEHLYDICNPVVVCPPDPIYCTYWKFTKRIPS